MLLQVAYILVIIVLNLVPWCCQRVKNWFRDKVSAIFFNVIITFIDSTFLVFAVQALLHIREAHKGRIEIDTAYFMSILTIVILICELVGLIVFL